LKIDKQNARVEHKCRTDLGQLATCYFIPGHTPDNTKYDLLHIKESAADAIKFNDLSI